jgi:hypothetical protein
MCIFYVHGLKRKGKKIKAVPVTDHGVPLYCKISMIPHCLDNRLTDGSEVVSLICRSPFTPQEDTWYSFLLETVKSRDIVRLEGLDKLKNSNDLTGGGL